MSGRRRGLALGASGLAALALGAAAFAQTSGGVYDLSWRAIAGGGKATGDAYTVHSAIGQPLAKTSSEGNYQVSSGFLGGGAEKYKRFLPVLARD
ncbi:hypothetical protein [Candidatus Amarobacter glycogenicus]|uniref:hypothetical protein n=1 Tax=Candidatus Amarobacter glycogenicus TaxID=3140699 RepID=UPI002A0F80F4|nr:hypothetical protein [Dehalococcoidia bacterium]